MCRKFSYILTLLFAVLVVACGSGNHTIEMHDTESRVWSEAEDFTYENSDTLYRRDISMKILTISPDSMVLEEDFTLRIPHLADMRPEEHTFVYRTGVVLKRRGEYLFRLTPMMPVQGIASVGIIVDEK